MLEGLEVQQLFHYLAFDNKNMESPIKLWRRQKTVKKLLNQKGKIISWTVIHVAGHAYAEHTPYPVILVELTNGKRVYGQLVDFNDEDLLIGQSVASVLRILRTSKTDLIAYGLKFRPVKS